MINNVLVKPYLKRARVFVIKSFFLSLILVFTNYWANAQGLNTNSKHSFVNYELPKSPEATEFFKRSFFPVNESSGTVNVNIPLFSLNTGTLRDDISLSYTTTGVKVDQEATITGLGWNLNYGGRIVVETRGGIDAYTHLPASSNALYQLGRTKDIVLGQAPNDRTILYNVVMCGDFANCPWTSNPNDPSIVGSDAEVIKDLALHGKGEPDLYHVSVMGKSFTFYKDLFTKEIKYYGEKHNYIITEIPQANTSHWRIIDDQGIEYTFDVEEYTEYLPAQNAIPGGVSSLLLTKVKHPNGDYINYEYTQMGAIQPVPSINYWVSISTGGYSGESSGISSYLSSTKIYTKYISKIYSKNFEMVFKYSNRLDLRGNGARKLDTISLIRKEDHKAIQKKYFEYDYFQGQYHDGYFPHGTYPDSLVGYYSKRLKLIALYESDSSSKIAPYKFFYNNSSNLPNKMSVARDHWGYYNGANNFIGNPLTMNKIIPSTFHLKNEGLLASDTLRDIYDMRSVVTYGILPIPANTGGAYRGTVASAINIGVLDSIVYPTGGSSKLFFEPHVSNYKTNEEFLGGGIRIKRMINYNHTNEINNVKAYEYILSNGKSSGIYNGEINYLNLRYKSSPDGDIAKVDPFLTISSNGISGENPQIVTYSRVIVKDISGGTTSNGYIEKKFNIVSPNQIYKIDPNPLTINFLNISASYAGYYGGELIEENFYDADLNLKKRISHNYSLKNYEIDIYSYKFEDHMNGIELQYGNSQVWASVRAIGWRRFALVASPASSFYKVLDSVTQTEYTTGGILKNTEKYIYNNIGQLNKTIVPQSDGSVLIQESLTVKEVNDLMKLATDSPIPDEGLFLDAEGLAINRLARKNILDKNIFNNLIKVVGNDSLMVDSYYNIYDQYGNKIQSYKLYNQNNKKLSHYKYPYYQVTTFPEFLFKRDTTYKLKSTARYLNNRFLIEVDDDNKVQTILMDSLNGIIIGTVEGVPYNSIAYTGFENGTITSFRIAGGTYSDEQTVAGKRSFLFNTSARIKFFPDTSIYKHYDISYWAKGGTLLLNGNAGVAKDNKNGWTLFEHSLKVNDSVTLSGSGYIDELRMIPSGAALKTYSYDPLVGVTAESDLQSSILYYHYDNDNRLSKITDMDNNILRKIDYQYQIKEGLETYYWNKTLRIPVSKTDCATGQVSNVVDYIVPAYTYFSTTSQAAADSLANAEYLANRLNFINENLVCSYYNTQQSAYFTSDSCASGLYPIPYLHVVPALTYSSFISQLQADSIATAALFAEGQDYANRNGTCSAPVGITYNNTRPVDFILELYNVHTNTTFTYTLPKNSSGVVGSSNFYPGVYNITITPPGSAGYWNYQFYTVVQNFVPVFNATNVDVCGSCATVTIN